MIGFDLSEVHLSVQELVRQFVAREVLPDIGRNDSEGRFDRSLLPRMAKLGLLGLCTPSRHGGFDFDYISLGIACEELEYGDTSLRVILSVHLALHGLTLLSWGSEAQKERWLRPQARGEKIATFGLDRARRRKRRGGNTEHGPARRQALHSQRRKDLDLAGRRGRPLPGVCLDRSGQAGQPGPPRPERLPGGTLHGGVFQRDPPPQVGDPGGEHRVLQPGGCPGPGRQSPGAGGRGVQDRHVRPGAGTLHGGRRGYRADSGPAWTPAGSTPWGGGPSKSPSPATNWSRR